VRARHKDQWEGDLSIQAAIRAAEERLGGLGRVLVRPSGTEPALRVMVEGPDADWIHLPDPIAEAIKTLSQRIAALEQRLAELDGGTAPGGAETELRERTGRSSAGG